MYMLLLLSRISHVRLCATPEMAAHQAPLSLGFSRQEHWSGVPFPSPMHESEKWKGSRSVCIAIYLNFFTTSKDVCVCVLAAQSCPTLCDPMDCSLPGTSVHGFLQARILEWVAISFSRGSSRPGIKPRSPALHVDSLLWRKLAFLRLHYLNLSNLAPEASILNVTYYSFRVSSSGGPRESIKLLLSCPKSISDAL